MSRTPPPPDSKDLAAKSGLLTELLRQLRLVWRLYFDPRVPLWVKTLPTAAVAYLVWPIDLVPELAIPVVGV